MLRNLGECNSSEESAMTVTTNIVIKLCHERHERDGTKKYDFNTDDQLTTF